jgi:hypothetical protein
MSSALDMSSNGGPGWTSGLMPAQLRKALELVETSRALSDQAIAQAKEAGAQRRGSSNGSSSKGGSSSSNGSGAPRSGAGSPSGNGVHAMR